MLIFAARQTARVRRKLQCVRVIIFLPAGGSISDQRIKIKNILMRLSLMLLPAGKNITQVSLLFFVNIVMQVDL